MSPSILIPFYDEDSSTLFLAGKGENVINAYEVGNVINVNVNDNVNEGRMSSIHMRSFVYGDHVGGNNHIFKLISSWATVGSP